MKLIKIVTICAAAATFTLGGCASGIIGGPVRVSAPAVSPWLITVEIVQAGPDSFTSKYTKEQFESLMKRLCNTQSHLKDTKGSCSASASVPVTPGEVTVMPRQAAHGFMWMKVTVKNGGAAADAFDFSRMRLVFPAYVSRPEIIYTHEQTTRDDFITSVNPNEEVTRYLVFTYRTGTTPYRLVYDQFFQGRVKGKLAVDLSSIKSE